MDAELSLEQGSREVVDELSINVLVDSLLEQGAGDAGLEESVPGASLARDCGRPATFIPIAPDHRPDFVAMRADEEAGAVVTPGDFPTWSFEFILCSVDEDGELHRFRLLSSQRNRSSTSERSRTILSFSKVSS